MRFGCCCTGTRDCGCDSIIPDGMKLHLVSPSRSANFGLPSGMAALCSDNCTSRLHRNLSYRTQYNVTQRGINYKKRFIFEQPEKKTQRWWVGCTYPASPDFADIYWDCEIYDGLGPYGTPNRGIAEILDLGSITHLDPIKSGNSSVQSPPFFYYRNGGNYIVGETGLTIIFTQRQNDKLFFRNRHQTNSGNCGRFNWWHGCKAVPKVELTGSGQTITQWLNYKGGIDVPAHAFEYRQVDVVSGTANGFKWFPFLPPTDTYGWYFRWDTGLTWDETRATPGLIFMNFTGAGGSYNVYGTNIVPFSRICDEPIDFPVRMAVFGQNPFNPPFFVNMTARITYETL